MIDGIVGIRHPDYNEPDSAQQKWRLSYEGGRPFIDAYLTKLSARETETDFQARKATAYCPAFAAAGIDEIKNSIYSRMSDIGRNAGPDSYLSAVQGRNGGVDLAGQGMNAFIGNKVLEELLVMRRVGVLVDNAKDLGLTMLDKGDKHPYLTCYTRENILSWSYYKQGNVKRLKSILLSEFVTMEDDAYGLPTMTQCRYRYMTLTGAGVVVKFYNHDGTETTQTILGLDQIPFHIIETNRSLMHNVADYQIALLNIESSDISYIMKSNYPFFYEYFDPKSEQVFGKPVVAPNETGTAAEAKSKDLEVKAGTSQGRRYASGLQPPGFVNPDPETLTASMRKADQLKADIRKLINLNLQSIGQQRQSSESKQEDRRGLESSLSYIGLLLETAENEIGRIWAKFEGSNKEPTVVYPMDYSLKSDEDRQIEAEALEASWQVVPSLEYKKLLLAQIVKLRAGHLMSPEIYNKIKAEINKAKTLNTDPKEILEDHKAGLVGDETASLARGYSEDEVEKAKKDRAERIKLTMEAQGGPQGDGAARGAPEMGGKSGSEEKINKPKRGEAK